jgi:hypothetical protein
MSRSQAVRVRWSVENKVRRWRSSPPSNEPSSEAWRLLDLKATETIDSEPFPTIAPYENGIMRGGGRVTCYAHPRGRITYLTPTISDGEYRAVLFAYSNTDLGIVQILIDGKPVGPKLDLWSAVDYMPTGPIELGRLRLSGGSHRLTVKVVGRNKESTGTNWSIEALDLLPSK